MFSDKLEIGLDDRIMERLLAGRQRAGLLEQTAEPENGKNSSLISSRNQALAEARNFLESQNDKKPEACQ
jgi:hypothetical protein